MLPIRPLAAVLLVLSAACETPTREDPPPALPKLTAGAAVEGTLQPGDSATYQVVAPSAEFRLLFQARSGSAADTLVAELVDPAGAVAARVRSAGTDTSLYEQRSDWRPPAAEEGWRVRVRGDSPGSGGAYSLALLPRDPSPERRPAAIVVGETVEGEALEVPGDVDEFVVEGAAGAEWIVFFQPLGAVGAEMTLELVDRGSGEVLRRVHAAAPTGSLEEVSTGRVALVRAGSYLVRIAGRSDFFGEVTGPYRFRVARVDRKPESGSSALSMGAIAEEAIGTVGDVDEFTFSAAAGQELSLLVQLVSGMAGGLRVELLRAGAAVADVVVDTPAGSLDEAGTGRVTLPESGVYTVRVSGPAMGAPEGATGHYRFELYPVDRRPEQGGELRVDGVTVSGAVARPGDLDEFEVQGTEGQLLVLHAEGPATLLPYMVIDLLAPGGERLARTTVDGTGRNYARRVQLPTTGTYLVRVGGHYERSFATGPYTIGIHSVSPAPEHAPATLRVGDTVHDRIERSGDLDVYTLRGEADREVVVFLGTPGVGGITLSFARSDALYPIIFAFAGGPSLDGSSTGRITLEDTTYRIVVDPQLLGIGTEGYAHEGEYALRVFPIDRRPEGRSATYVLGDTVRGEPLYPSGDIDEYTFELGAPTPLRIFWSGPTDLGGAVYGYLYDEAEGRIVWTNFDRDGGGLVRQKTLPAGRYRLSVLDPFMVAPRSHQGPGPPRLNYRFAFIP